MPQDMTWINAIRKVLRDEGRPMHYSAISDAILDQGLKKTSGATPSQTVASQLSTRIQDGSNEFVRVSQGVYALVVGENADIVMEASEKSDDLSQTGALRAFGMFWRRENVIWRSGGSIFGRQNIKSKPVDFASQIGVYLLHDRDRVVYVGRATDTLYSRLYAHVGDRMEGRWDRFSWFGLKEVNDDSSLSDHTPDWTPTVVIETLEAALIETVEPAQNRKRGDNFSAVEFLQIRDPEIDRRSQKDLLAELASRID